MNNKNYLNIVIIIAAVCFTIFIGMQKDSMKIISRDFMNKSFLIYVGCITVFSYIVFSTKSKTDNDKRFKEALRKGLAALIVAYLAHLDMIFAPFFVVFSLDYFLSGWV